MKKSDHALGMFGLCVVSRHAQAGDRTQDFVGIGVRGDLTGGDRGSKKRSGGGTKTFLETRKQTFEHRVS